jgi:hypothetical protein
VQQEFSSLMNDMQWDSLHNNNSERDKIDTTVSTFVLLHVGGYVTCFDPLLGSSSGVPLTTNKTNVDTAVSKTKKKLNSVAFSPQATYTHRETAACRRS